MSRAVQELFTELRAELQKPDWSWAYNSSFMYSFPGRWRELSAGEKAQFDEEFAPYLEQELARRVSDAERSISLNYYSNDFTDKDKFRWARHISFHYDYNTYTKKWIKEMKPKLERCVHADTSALTLYRLGHRGAVAFMDMLQDTVLGDARELAVILDAHYFRNKPGRAKEVLSHALRLWGEGLEHFAFGFQYVYGSVGLDEALDAVMELAPHLPSLKRLSLKNVSGTRAIVREVLSSFAHIEYLSVDMHDVSNWSQLPEDTIREHVDALCELDAARDLKGLCMRVPSEPQRERLRASETLAHIEQLQISDPDFPDNPLTKRWEDAQRNFGDAIEQAAQGTGDAANPLADQQASLTELTISGDKRGTPEKMKALLFESEGVPRVFSAATKVMVLDVPSSSMGLFLEHGAASVPRLLELAVSRADVRPEDVARTAPMERVRTLRLNGLTAQSIRLMLGFEDEPTFPGVEEVHIDVEAKHIAEVYGYLSERLPSMQALALESYHDFPEYFRLLRDAPLWGKLERMQFMYSSYSGDVEFCLTQAQDDTLPVQMRQHFVRLAIQYTSKRHLAKAAKYLGLSKYSRFNKRQLRDAIVGALPEELQDYESYSSGYWSRDWIDLTE